MKLIATTTCVLACLIGSTHGWVVPKVDLQKALSVASVSAAIATAPLVANAEVSFNGSYADPFHPNCQRLISVVGSDAYLKGTDGNPGCPNDGSGRRWSLSGTVDGSSILVDFSPKGGPANLKGVWDATAPPGIKWPDGNKWTLKE